MIFKAAFHDIYGTVKKDHGSSLNLACLLIEKFSLQSINCTPSMRR